MSENNGNTTISITSGTIIKTILILGVCYLAYVLQDLVLVMLTAIMIASGLNPMIRAVQSLKLPRVVGVLAVYAVFLGVFGGLLYFFMPTFIDDLNLLSSSLPSYVQTADLWNPLSDAGTSLNGAGGIGESLSLPSFSLTELANSLGQAFSNSGIFSTISGIFGGIVSFILIIVFSFYLSVQEDGVGDFLRIIVPLRYENYVIGLWKRSQEKIGLWLQGQLLLGVLVGVLTYLGLSILGVRNALFLSLIAMIFELIPIFGIVLATIPALAVAITDGGFSLAFLVLGLYVIVQQFEAHLIYPLVVKKIVGIPSILVILTLLAGAKLAGFLGILLSVPFAAIAVELLSDLDKSKHGRA